MTSIDIIRRPQWSTLIFGVVVLAVPFAIKGGYVIGVLFGVFTIGKFLFYVFANRTLKIVISEEIILLYRKYGGSDECQLDNLKHIRIWEEELTFCTSMRFYTFRDTEIAPQKWEVLHSEISKIKAATKTS